MKIIFMDIIIIHATCKKIFVQFDLHKNYFIQKFTRRKKSELQYVDAAYTCVTYRPELKLNFFASA